jgi:hypothetical protein
MRLPTYISGRARSRYRRLRAAGVGLCLFAGAALIAAPACGGGGGSGDNGVPLFSGGTANSPVVAAVIHPDPASGGGG